MNADIKDFEKLVIQKQMLESEIKINIQRKEINGYLKKGLANLSDDEISYLQQLVNNENELFSKMIKMQTELRSGE